MIDVLEPPVETQPTSLPSESMAALDTLFSADPSPVVSPPPLVPEAGVTPVVPSKIETDLDDIPKPRAKPEPAVRAPHADDPKTLKDFRAHYETTKKERDDYASKYKALQEAQESGTKREVEKARSELAAEMDGHRKRADDLETEMKFVKYELTSTYKNDIHKPLVAAWQKAIDDIKGATILLEDGTEREATSGDVQQLVQLSMSEASRRARELFGDASGEMMAHRRQILNLTEIRDNAVNEWKTKGSEREAEQQRNDDQGRERVVGMWENSIKELTDNNRELFGDDDKDTEGNEFLKKADSFVRLAFTGQGMREGLTAEQRTELVTRAQANVAVRARAFGRERMRSMRLQTRVEELEGKLAGYEKSEPVNGSVKTEDGGDRKLARPEDVIDFM